MTADERPRGNGGAEVAGGAKVSLTQGSDSGRDAGPLRSLLEAEARAHGLPLKALTVLASQNDPFRVDTPAGHRDGAWLATQVAELGLGHRKIHLRGLHYAVIGRTRPDGQQYVNSEECWTWLQSTASKAARWLGYLPWDRVVDQRNAEPVVRLHQSGQAIWLDLGGLRVELPEEVSEPEVHIHVEPRQAHRLVIFGEKSSLEPELTRVADRFGADLFLPTGEISDTLMHTMASAAASDGRPMVVFTFSDCDPSGWQMPVSIARKLQGFRASLFPDLEFQVRRVALLPEHVHEYGLPSTPLKDTERRADAWTQAKGVQQTEIDALAALQPGRLFRLAANALGRFFDSSLTDRGIDARAAWKAEAQARLADLIGAEQLSNYRSEQQVRLDGLRVEIAKLNEAMQVDVSGFEWPEFQCPEPKVTEPDDPPLIDSRWTFAEQCSRLKAAKEYREADQ